MGKESSNSLFHLLKVLIMCIFISLSNQIKNPFHILQYYLHNNMTQILPEISYDLETSRGEQKFPQSSQDDTQLQNGTFQDNYPAFVLQFFQQLSVTFNEKSSKKPAQSEKNRPKKKSPEKPFDLSMIVMKPFNKKKASFFEPLVSSSFEYTLEGFKCIISEFQQNDYSYLYKLQANLFQFVKTVLKDWAFNKAQYQTCFKRFLDLIKVKIEYMSQSRVVYGLIYKIQAELEQLLDYQGSRRWINCDQHLSDTLFQHFIQQLQTRTTRSGVYYVRDAMTDKRIPLSDFIATCKRYFTQNSAWKDIFTIVTNHVKERDYKDTPAAPPQDLMIRDDPFLERLQTVSFFQMNSNIYQPSRRDKILVLGGNIKQVDTNVGKIKDQICALLNNSVGGVILFDCSFSYNQVLPRGQFIIEKEKSEAEQRIAELLNGIYPKPLLCQNIFLSWVPLTETKLDVSLHQGKKPARTYVDGFYVARLVVKATKMHQVYYYTQEEKPIMSVRNGSLFDSEKKQIKGKNIYKIIKSKFKEFIVQCEDNVEEDSFEMNFYRYKLNHFYQKSAPLQIGKQVFEIKQKGPDGTQQNGNSYKYASVVVAKKSDHETIKKNLMKNGISVCIKTPFENLKLKGAIHSGILYHNNRFDELLSVINFNPDFQFSGRYLLVILITEFIKLTDRNQKNVMSRQDFDSLAGWLRKDYPSESLKMWEFVTEKKELEYYIETGSKESSLFIYIVMTQFMEKSSFKNPKGIESMNETDRTARFRVYYQSD